MKIISTILLALCLVMGYSVLSYAGEVDIHIEFSYNGMPDLETLGFKLYQTDPNGVDVVVATIEGGDVRSWDGIIPVVVGRSMYSLTAYSATIESSKSNAYPFEYIEPTSSGMPAPTIIIKFN